MDAHVADTTGTPAHAVSPVRGGSEYKLPWTGDRHVTDHRSMPIPVASAFAQRSSQTYTLPDLILNPTVRTRVGRTKLDGLRSALLRVETLCGHA